MRTKQAWVWVSADETKSLARQRHERISHSKAWQYLVNRRVYLHSVRSTNAGVAPGTFDRCNLSAGTDACAQGLPWSLVPCRQKSTSRWHGLAINIFVAGYEQGAATEHGFGWIRGNGLLVPPIQGPPELELEPKAKARSRAQRTNANDVSLNPLRYAIPSNHQPVWMAFGVQTQLNNMSFACISRWCCYPHRSWPNATRGVMVAAKESS